MEQIDIKDISGAILLTTLINEGCKRKFTLMKEDYIMLKFSLENPIYFKLGSYVECNFGLFEVCDLQKPAFNTNTAGYDYELRLDAYYWKWKNKIFKYTPETAGQEASWNLTAPLDVQAGIVLRNLKALGYTYKGQDFVFSIDSTVENKSQLMSYDNINILDACFEMAKKWDCECWVTENIIHFGRCESGDAVDFEIGKNVQEMSQSESQSTYATRIYAFGSTRNIPADYRPIDETVVVNGVVQRRLMLPEGTPYIDAYPDMTTEEAVEQVVIFDEVYPRRTGIMSDVTTIEVPDKVENEDGTTTEEKWNAYRFRDTGVNFSEKYILPGQELRIRFASGLLNGLEFAVKFNPEGKPEKLEDGGWNPEAQLWEIVRNEDYGRPLPGDVLFPQDGDEYVLSGWDSTKITELGLVGAAEQELKEKTEKYAAKSKIDPSTYGCTMMSNDAYREDGVHNFYGIGQKVNLINKAYFENGRQSRVIGFEFNLDYSFDSPVYTVGETTAYSRIGELEEKVESLTLKGQTYTGGGGSGVYVIGSHDSTPATDHNVYSALRSLIMFMRKDTEERTGFLLSLLGGTVIKKYAKFGDFVTGVSGGYIDEKGNLEMESGVFRKRLFVPEIAYNRTTYFKGRMVNSPGGGCTVLSYVDNGDGTYTIAPDLTDADGLSQFVDDILTTYFVTKNSEGKLNGFEEMKFRVTAADYTAKKFTVIPRPGHSDWKPAEQMVLAQTGNFTDPERQTYILIDSVNGNNCITFFDNANTWDPEPAQMPAWFGKKKGMTVAGINADNYSAVLQNIIMTGLIFQIDEITGNKVRVPLDKGEWVAGKYAYYDRVSHNGALWLCVDDNGTTTEPSDDNPAWLKQVDKGADGATGPQGVPGTPGKDGVTYYTWIRYADNAQGGGISNNPTGKAYIGFAYNKTSAVESNTPSDYTWSEIKGEQGVPGAPGADGKTYYTWIAYSDNADGTGMYQQPKDTTKYIGIAVNKETATESSNPSDYTWSLFKGKDGADGLSVIGGGHWESANTPYAKNSTVSFAGGSYLSKVETSNPPIKIAKFRNGRLRRKRDGGYILAGRSANRTVHADWQEMVAPVGPSASYWLDSPVSVINFTSTGTPSPSGFLVTCKQNVAGNVSTCSTLYLAARKYNGSWLTHVGATLSNQISVPATAGYTQFAVRAYKSASDASAWNDNYVAEKGVGVANDGSIGATGATGAFPRDRGVFASGQTYVWNADYRDKVIYLIGGVYYNFLVKNYGASVTAAPTSANGDSNWEAMQKFVNIATDTLFADGANVAGFMFKDKVLKSFNDKGETLLINGETGYFKCKNADITGTITADKGRIGPFSIVSGVLSSKILYENETNKYVGFNLSAGQIEFYNERTFANVRIGGNTQFVTIEGIKYDAGIDIQSPNAMIGMHIKTPSIPLFVEGGNIFLHPNNDSYVSLRGIVGNWRSISVKASLNNNDDNVMFINRDNIEVTLPPDVPGHTIYFKRMSGGVRLTGGRILPAPGGQEVSYIDLDFASGFIKCMGNYWVMFYCG